MKIFTYILILISCISIYINYNVYFSHLIQRQLLEDFNSGNYRESTTAKFNALNTDLPDITVTSIPIKHLLSRYYFLGGNYERALTLIDEGFEANPYLQLGNVLKAEYYETLKVKDSMIYYGNLAFKNQPKNIRHFMAKMKVVSSDQDLNELVMSYDKVKDIYDKNYPLVLFSTLLTFEKIPDSIKEYVKLISQKYSNETDVRVAKDIIFYGQDNVNKSIEVSSNAVNFFKEGKLDDALAEYKKAIKFNPGDYTNFENIGLILNSQKRFDHSINYLKTVIDSLIRPEPINGKAELILGDSYLNLGIKDSACYYLSLSKGHNNKKAFQLHAKNCYN